MQESSKKIHEKLDKMYQDQKSKNFVLHLIRAYMPLNKVSKVFMKPEKLSKFKCALTGTKLISIDEIFEIMNSEEYHESFIDDLKYNTGLQEKPDDYKPTLLKLSKGRLMGFQGRDTTTYLCQEAAQCLYDWVSNKIIQGDGKINWTLRQMQEDHFNKANPFSKKKPKNKPRNQNKRAKTSLGDIDALKKLKEKLNS